MGSEFDFETAFEEEIAAVPDDQFDRSRFVAGVGPLAADILLIGEAPGEREVARGEPFVGPAGERLDEVLAEVGLDRRDLYITNLVKVRPPENRDPRRGEIDAWRPLLDAELDRVDPAIVVALGTFATRELLGTDAPLNEVHGEIHEVDGRRILPTYHPAATFYGNDAKRALRDDLARVAEIGAAGSG